MKSEASPTKNTDFDKHGNAAKSISLYPLKVDSAVAALLKVKTRA
jgi:hypothetical protein